MSVIFIFFSDVSLVFISLFNLNTVVFQLYSREKAIISKKI